MQHPDTTGAVHTNRRAALAVAAALAFIAALTLTPAPGHAQLSPTCLVCGMRGVADAVLNVFLFMPLGLALAYRGLDLLRAVPLGAALSIAIELAQLFIPGRDSSLGDVVTNTLGTAAGVLAWRLAPPLFAWIQRRARVLAVAVPLATVAGLALGALLLRPALPERGYVPAWGWRGCTRNGSTAA